MSYYPTDQLCSPNRSEKKTRHRKDVVGILTMDGRCFQRSETKWSYFFRKKLSQDSELKVSVAVVIVTPELLLWKFQNVKHEEHKESVEWRPLTGKWEPIGIHLRRSPTLDVEDDGGKWEHTEETWRIRGCKTWIQTYRPSQH